MGDIPIGYEEVKDTSIPAGYVEIPAGYEEVKDGPSKVESAIRGLAQGASFGFADELTALGESAFTPKTYQQALAESRANYKSAEETNPATYMASDVVGSVLPAIATGGLGLTGLA